MRVAASAAASAEIRTTSDARRRHNEVPYEQTAAIVQRLAVLMSAGVSPRSAWVYVAESAGSRVVSDIAASQQQADLAQVIAERALAEPASHRDSWLALAAAWRVATDAGAPLSAALREFAASLRSLAAAQSDVAVALSGPAATARLVTVLPVVGLLFGVILGFDTLAVLVTTIPGIACLVVGGLLIWASRRWTRHLVASATVSDVTVGLLLDLTAISVSGGGALDRAQNRVEQAMASVGLVSSGQESVAEVIALSSRAGVPAAELLRSEAEQARRQARADAKRKAARLSVQLMLPLGVCVLPAFMALGVAPLLISVISSTISGFHG